MASIPQLILQYRKDILAAANEDAKKELFKNLLTTFYSKHPEAKATIRRMSIGAEWKIQNILLRDEGGRNKTGRADTQYGTIIIEFENDLRKTGEHAQEQLKEYLAGNWNSGNTYNFTLVATDCLRWEIFGVRPECYIGRGMGDLPAEEIELQQIDSFELAEENIDHFFSFIDRYLFRAEKQVPTLHSIEADFGNGSPVFTDVFRDLRRHYDTVADDPAIETAYREWANFLSIAYGSFQASPEVFLIHTYLSVFAKLIGYTVITRDMRINEDEMRKILTGEAFKKLYISNFVENDFFQWVAEDKHFKKLDYTFFKIADKINDYVFTEVKADILKGMYQGLIDLDTRHALGEYYTPDWLCEQVCESLDFEANARILDPSCGSGSFLIAATNRLLALHPDLTAGELAAQVAGIDIHPLSVQIAKTSLVLAFGAEKLTANKENFNLRIYLANSLLARADAVSLWGEKYRIKIDTYSVEIDRNFFDDIETFDKAISIAEEFAAVSVNKSVIRIDVFEKKLNQANIFPSADTVIDLYSVYKILKEVKEKGRDSIWKYIIQNTYKPYFLRQHFDYIVGNPPWFTYSSVSNADYQVELKELADKYDITPTQKKNMPHLEIAAIFLAHAANFYLRPKGNIAFVMPRSFLLADQHDNTRTGKAQGFYLTEIWDTQDVSPLFNIPSCVLFARQGGVRNGHANGNGNGNGHSKRALPADGIGGRTYSGRLPRHNATWKEAKKKVKIKEVQWFFNTLKKNTALTNNVQGEEKHNINVYKEKFSQGATIVPRNFYFVMSEQFPAPHEISRAYWRGFDVLIESDEANDEFAKMPWKALKLRSSYIQTDYFYRTAIAKNIAPFALIHPPIVILPVQITTNALQEKKLKLMTTEDILEEAHLEVYKWFVKAEELWDKHKTESAKSMSFLNRLDFQRGLTSQNLNKRYLVLYSTSAKNANACVLDRETLDFDFLAESATYVYFTDDLNEAYFLSAFINSSLANNAIKPFQAAGLFGPRHVHKKILDVGLPLFDPKDPLHQQMAALGETCTNKAAAWLQEAKLKPHGYSIGKVRLEIKSLIADELSAIDAILEEIIAQ